jgi:hypothetical protein
VVRFLAYAADWIEKRVRSIAVRDELTDEWKQRGVREQNEFASISPPGTISGTMYPWSWSRESRWR